MATRTTKTTKTVKKATTSIDATGVRPDDYTPQRGFKANLSLADFDDSQLFAEMRRRGYTGELRYVKVVTV